jgi:hypothetical protein
VIVVAVGGGGIKPMSARWERTMARYDAEKPRIAEAARNAPSLKQQAQQTAQTAQDKEGADGSANGNAPIGAHGS